MDRQLFSIDYISKPRAEILFYQKRRIAHRILTESNSHITSEEGKRLLHNTGSFLATMYDKLNIMFM